ncbi:MAG: LLM class flavin-dependent oxidoreductase [Rhodospirillaceae bacterium]|nr:LLM class flavin-dependent oxidoreductase [Rhodospirillaceae bacterium]
MTQYSVLDLAPIPQGTTAGDSLRNSLDLAQHAERWGYTRYWLAEHHNFPGIASAATSVVIGHIAGGTSTIRVGAGGIMLPNHSPLVIAEQFGTLESLYPGRIDLGLGRAPGTDQLTWRALRRDPGAAERFPQDVAELQALLGPAQPDQRIHAVPGVGTQVPLWMLGSSLFGAQLAAHMGLPFAFASHFAPDALIEALAIYRARFTPSAQLDRPYAVVGVGVVAADTDIEAQRIATSVRQAFVGIIRNARTQLPPPVDDMDAIWSPAEKAHVERMLRYTFVGAKETVRAGLAKTIAETGADEIMATGMIFDHAARVRSYEILAEAMRGL